MDAHSHRPQLALGLGLTKFAAVVHRKYCRQQFILRYVSLVEWYSTIIWPMLQALSKLARQTITSIAQHGYIYARRLETLSA